MFASGAHCTQSGGEEPEGCRGCRVQRRGHWQHQERRLSEEVGKPGFPGSGAVPPTRLDKASDTRLPSRHTEHEPSCSRKPSAASAAKRPNVAGSRLNGLPHSSECRSHSGWRCCWARDPSRDGRPGVPQNRRVAHDRPDPPRGRSLNMPADAELTATGRSGGTSSALALASVLVDDRTGAGGNSRSLSIELLQRATRDDFDRWMTTALPRHGASGQRRDHGPKSRPRHGLAA